MSEQVSKARTLAVMERSDRATLVLVTLITAAAMAKPEPGGGERRPAYIGRHFVASQPDLDLAAAGSRPGGLGPLSRCTVPWAGR
jgi:hypothetical protein